MPRRQPKIARGNWVLTNSVTHFLGEPFPIKVYTFRTQSGFKAVMQKDPSHRPFTEPYTARIVTPDGEPARYTTSDGTTYGCMILHVNLPEAKRTVQENVRLAEIYARQNPGQPEPTSR